MDERREDLADGDGERDVFAAFGESDRCTSSFPGVEARELPPLNGSDLARMRLRLRAMKTLKGAMKLVNLHAYIDLVGSKRHSAPRV